MTIITPDFVRSCEGNCRINSTGTISTLMAYTPTYNKQGFIISKDPNTVSTTYKCSTCDKTWTCKVKNGEMEIIKND